MIVECQLQFDVSTGFYTFDAFSDLYKLRFGLNDSRETES